MLSSWPLRFISRPSQTPHRKNTFGRVISCPQERTIVNRLHREVYSSLRGSDSLKQCQLPGDVSRQ